MTIDDNLLRLFIFITMFAVVIQAGILVALYLSVRKSTAKMEALATEVKSKALPTMDTVRSTLETVQSKLVRNQLGRIDATLTDALDRTRLQVIRADELLNRTMDRVEETSDAVHKTVLSPLRQVTGLITAISTGVEVFLGQKRRQPKNGGGVPQDEMFI